MRITVSAALCAISLAGATANSLQVRGAAEGQSPRFVDIASEVGLGPAVIPETVARACFADLTSGGWPDAVIDRHRVFLNRPCSHSSVGRRFDEVPPEKTGLEAPAAGSVVVFADLDNDGHLDAVVAEFIDAMNPNWNDHGRRTGWHQGRGNGTFGERQPIDAAPPRPTTSIAVADVNLNGALDLYIGNTYVRYGGGFEGHANDLLLSERCGGWSRQQLPEDVHDFTTEADLGGRPTFGVMILSNPLGERSMLLELSYGRRWNRAWVCEPCGPLGGPFGGWRDIAPEIGLDGDATRHGRYPLWLKERAKTDPRFDRPDEKPFRANGNTFDAAVGDVNNNGRFDIFISEITHGWAGDSSDRSRFVFNKGERFVEDARYNVDRIPPAPDPNDELQPHNWNHGDLFCELADLNHSGVLDLILSSGDYPDDQRLRMYVQQGTASTGGRSMQDVSIDWRVRHDGSQQISLADIDGDGALDVLVGQTFNRFTPEQREGRSPRLRLFHNRATEGRRSITLRLEGDGLTANRDALGAIVKARVGEVTMQRQLIGVGGHAGKQHDFIVHFGLGEADSVDELTVVWSNADRTAQSFTTVPAGRYRLTQHETLVPLDPP